MWHYAMAAHGLTGFGHHAIHRSTVAVSKNDAQVYAYVSGGLLLETVFTLCVSVVLITIDLPKAALAVSGLSLLMILPWIIIDGISICRGRIAGDLSGLWFPARMPTAVLFLFILATRAAIIRYASTS